MVGIERPLLLFPGFPLLIKLYGNNTGLIFAVKMLTLKQFLVISDHGFLHSGD
jgi:hypothetical protein